MKESGPLSDGEEQDCAVRSVESRSRHALVIFATSTQVAPCAEYELIRHSAEGLKAFIQTNMPLLRAFGHFGDQLEGLVHPES